jgi:hypothetical protein
MALIKKNISTALVKYEKQNSDIQILPDNEQWKNRFEIKSESSNRLYTVAQNKKTGVWGCSCFGWIRYRKCKHLTSLKPLLESINKEQLTLA